MIYYLSLYPALADRFATDEPISIYLISFSASTVNDLSLYALVDPMTSIRASDLLATG